MNLGFPFSGCTGLGDLRSYFFYGGTVVLIERETIAFICPVFDKKNRLFLGLNARTLNPQP